MTPRPIPQATGLWRHDAAIASALFVMVSVWAAATQQTERIFGDAQMYHRMAQQFAEGQVPVAVEAPFVYRPATPWLASAANPMLSRILPRRLDAAIEDAAGLKGVPGFYLVNILAAFATLHLLLAWMRTFDLDARLRLLGVTLWTIAWHAPVRFVYFYPANAEPLFLMHLVAALLVIERMRNVGTLPAALAVSPILFTGTLARESMAAVLVVFLVARLARSPRPAGTQLITLVIPAGAVAAAVAMTRLTGTPTNEFDVFAEAARISAEKPVFTWLLAWCFAFGPPVMALLVAGWREVRGFLDAHPHLAVHLTLVGGLAFVGGTDTERILGWAAPVVFLLAAIAIGAQLELLRRRRGLALVLIAVQLVSARVFWPIPVGVDEVRPFATLSWDLASLMAILDKALVIDNYYANLWSFFGSRAVHAWVLAADLVFITAVAWRLRLAARTLTAAAPTASAAWVGSNRSTAS